LNIQKLEKPVGCIEALAAAHRGGGVTITDLIRNVGMSQKTAYSSLEKLMELDLLACEDLVDGGRTVRRYSTRDKAEKLAMYLDAVCTTMKELERKNGTKNLNRLPVGSLAILIKIYKEGFTTISDLREEDGMCGNTAYSALDSLKDSGLIFQEVESEFPRTVKKYKLTEDGAYLGRILDLADIAMSLLDENSVQ
jgi:DNA-binding IclR family transcriptional regulator